ncbi:MAG: ABC transporter permease [Gammaproteobacteria bacterium]|nr:ABC transporter permease [Gammaproteobacteria bacterium]
MSNMYIITTLVRKDILLYLQNRKAILITLIAPIVMAAFFGYVFNTDSNKKPSKTPIALVDKDASTLSAAIAAKFSADATLDIVTTSEDEALKLVRSGKRRAAIVLPPNFERDINVQSSSDAKPAITIQYDPSQAYILGIINGVMTQYVMAAIVKNQFGRNAPEKLLPFRAKATEVTTNSAQKYNSFAHSFAGMTVQFILFMGIEFGIGLLLMRRQDIWKRLRIAPISLVDMIASRIIASTMVGLGLITAIYIAAIGLFGVRVAGNWLGFIAIIIAFALFNASFGLLIAAIGKSPEVARSIAIICHSHFGDAGRRMGTVIYISCVAAEPIATHPDLLGN